MGMATTKRMAASILGVGESRIRVKPGNEKRVGEALTREDVRSLIKEGLVLALPSRTPSRAVARVKASQKKKGRRKGLGSRGGRKYSKVSRKFIWMSKVRAQRNMLNKMRSQNRLKKGSFRGVYSMVKGHAFKAVSQMMTHMEESGILEKREKKG